MTQKVPNLIKNKEECCGCSACYAICPNNAITMVRDTEGFEYPEIDSDLCVGCGLCISVCAFSVDLGKKANSI